MEATQFFKIFRDREKEGPHLFFSTQTACKILVEQDLCTSFLENSLSPEEEQQLSDLGFLVPGREAEIRDMPALIDRRNDLNTALTITVVLNLDCNFSCTYCYEGSHKGNRYLSEETTEHLIRFIKSRFTDQKKILVVDFFGGEPLLSLGRIETISKALQSFCSDRGAAYLSTLVTNGSLLKPSVAESLAALGLRSAKITLDGPARIHNQYRPFKSGAGSFDAVFNNIKACCDIVKIGIGGNYTQETFPHFVSLLDYLEEQNLTPDKLHMVKFDPVLATGGFGPELQQGCVSLNEPWIRDAEKLLREEILKRGYKTPKTGPLLCAVEHRDQYVVNYNGDLYKCPGFLGNEQFVIGNVQTGAGEYSDIYNLDIWKTERCLHCEYLPMCFGGCRYMTFLRNGKIDAVDCKKAYLDAQLETLVRQDIAYQLPSDSQ